MFQLFKKNKQNAASSETQPAQTAGIRWESLLNGKREIRYFYFEDNVSQISFGTEAFDGPDILLDRDFPFYFSVSYNKDGDSYRVVNDFDGPLRAYSRGEKLIYEIDSFTFL